MDYADIQVSKSEIRITLKPVTINDMAKTGELVERYKNAVTNNNKIRLIVDCKKLISVKQSIAFHYVKKLRKFENDNRARFIDKTVVITKPGLRILANLIMRIFPPVVKTRIVKEEN